MGPRSSIALATAAAAGLAACIVIRRLGTKPLWLDEAVSVSVAHRPLARVLAVLAHHDANAGLYDVLLHGWLSVGHSVAWARGFSAGCFIGTAALATWAMGRRFGPVTGVACGAVVATNPFLLFYAQEARPYALTVLLAVASMVALFADEDEPKMGAYVLTTVALIYADLFAVLFVAAGATALLLVRRRRGTPLPAGVMRAWMVVATATAPLALWTMLRQHSQISWLTRPPLHALGHTYFEMTVGWLGVVGIVALTALAALRRRSADDGALLTALGAAFVAPPLVLWVIAQVVPAFVDRYVIASTVGAIGCAVLAARMAASMSRVGRMLAAGFVAALVVVGGQHIAALESRPYKYEDPPAVVAFVNRQARAGDAIAYGGGGLRTVIDTYARPSRTFPIDLAVAPGGDAVHQDDIYAREVTPATLRTRLTAIDRLWLVTDPSDHRYPSEGALAPLRATVVAEYRVVVSGSFPGIDVTLYVRGTSAG